MAPPDPVAAELRSIARRRRSLATLRGDEIDAYCRARLAGWSWAAIGRVVEIEGEAVDMAVRRAARKGHALALRVRAETGRRAAS